eukprot:228771_1
MASTIKSASFRASRSVVNVILFIKASASAALVRSLETSLSTLFWMRSRPRSKKEASVSYAMMEEWMLSLTAAAAAVWAMPWPMRPRPITPSLSNPLDDAMGVDEEIDRRRRDLEFWPEVEASREKVDDSMMDGFDCLNEMMLQYEGSIYEQRIAIDHCDFKITPTPIDLKKK